MNSKVKSPVRNNWKGMMKEGRFRAFRNLPVGWVLQILHSTDRSDRYFRLLLELFVVLIALSAVYFFNGSLDLVPVILTLLVIHTLSWLLVGNFWVYLLDSFKFVKNTGLNNTLSFIEWVARMHSRSDCANAILVYGSFCRNMFHIRSDLDLRIVRRTDSSLGLMTLVYGNLIRAYAFFKGIPVDYQIVDSMAFLRGQMRDDEQPVVVFQRQGFQIDNAGRSFKEVLVEPDKLLRDGPGSA